MDLRFTPQLGGGRRGKTEASRARQRQAAPVDGLGSVVVRAEGSPEHKRSRAQAGRAQSVTQDWKERRGMRTGEGSRSAKTMVSAGPIGLESPGDPPLKEVSFLGVTLSQLSFEELCAVVSRRIRDREPGFIVTPNIDHICRNHRDATFREACTKAFLKVADGMPLIWTARLLGKPLPQKLSGSDLVPRLSEYAASQGYSVFYFGAAEGVAAEAARRLKAQYPGLKVAGIHSPPMEFERDSDANREAVRCVRDAAPDICFVALGSPRQEVWIADHCQAMGVPVVLGIGASLDFASGRIRRAPVWMQRSGLEWCWRLCREPRRLWRRYLIEDLLFFVLLAREVRKCRRFPFRPMNR